MASHTLKCALLVVLWPVSIGASSPTHVFVDDCGLEQPGQPAPTPVPPRPFEVPVDDQTPPVLQRAALAPAFLSGTPLPRALGPGALKGKVIYLSPGHGFTWTVSGALQQWTTQRGNTNQIVEDLVSTETVSQWLVPMLENAGATVIVVRETDFAPLTIVDNADPQYQETGEPFTDSSLKGWGRAAEPLDGTVLPFTLGTNRLVNAAATKTATATFSAALTQEGDYSVSIAYTSFSGRVKDAHFVVVHAGGETHFRVNQEQHGGTWLRLGTFHFKANVPAVVRMENDSTEPIADGVVQNISVDAVKFGGGVGNVTRGQGTSQRPRAEESARYHAQLAGAPLSVFAPNSNEPSSDRTNDIGTRSRFAAWQHPDGEDAVYVAWHTNALNGNVRGTQTYVYGSKSVDTCSLGADYAGVAGSKELGAFIAAQLESGFRSPNGFNEPTWKSFGTRCANFGELNPMNNSEMPGVLLEIAFHDNVKDAEALKAPLFRSVAARAIVQGIVRYFASKDGQPARYLPETPTHVAAYWQAGNKVLLQWRAAQRDFTQVKGDVATSFRVYQSADGKAWDDGVETTEPFLLIERPDGQARYFRVAAVNAGGISFPSGTVAARPSSPGKPRVLLVNAFDRLERDLAPFEEISQGALGPVLRVFLKNINDGSHSTAHAEALSLAGYGFDGVFRESLAADDVSLRDYQGVDWLSARGRSGGVTPDAVEQTKLKTFVTEGGKLFYSGLVTGADVFAQEALAVQVDGGVPVTALNGAGPLASLQNVALRSTGLKPTDAFAVSNLTPVSPATTVAVAAGGAVVGVQSLNAAFLSVPLEQVSVTEERSKLIELVFQSLALQPFDGGLVARDGGLTPFDAGPEPQPPVVDGGVVAALEYAALGEVEGELAKKGCGCDANAGLVLAGIAVVWVARRKRKSMRPAG
jgi:N-acetylmuramoyl-L-alanine amidase